MAIEKAFIVGSGLMGSGIAQVCAQAGVQVSIYDSNPEAVSKAVKNIEWSVGKLVEKGRLSEEKDAIVERVAPSSDVAEAAKADLVIEAVFEKLEIKQEVFRQVGAIARPEALLASNTSAISITELAACVPGPERFLGLHFFSPVPMTQAVEVVKGMSTSDETVDKGKAFALQIGKEPIMVYRDVAGFVLNRVNLPSTMEAMRLVEEKVTTVEDVDKGLRLGFGRKMGVFETSDMVGLDVTYGALMAMYQETGDQRWYPPMILRRMVKAGRLGKKTGGGWYEYDEKGVRIGPSKL